MCLAISILEKKASHAVLQGAAATSTLGVGLAGCKPGMTFM